MVDGWLGYSDNNATQPSWGLGLAELGKTQNEQYSMTDHSTTT